MKHNHLWDLSPSSSRVATFLCPVLVALILTPCIAMAYHFEIPPEHYWQYESSIMSVVSGIVDPSYSRLEPPLLGVVNSISSVTASAFARADALIRVNPTSIEFSFDNYTESLPPNYYPYSITDFLIVCRIVRDIGDPLNDYVDVSYSWTATSAGSHDDHGGSSTSVMGAGYHGEYGAHWDFGERMSVDNCESDSDAGVWHVRIDPVQIDSENFVCVRIGAVAGSRSQSSFQWQDISGEGYIALPGDPIPAPASSWGQVKSLFR